MPQLLFVGIAPDPPEGEQKKTQFLQIFLKACKHQTADYAGQN